MLPLQQASGSSDSHPNQAETTLVTPQLVKQVFDAAPANEALTDVVGPSTTIPETSQLTFSNPNNILHQAYIGQMRASPREGLEAHLLFASICTPSSLAGSQFALT